VRALAGVSSTHTFLNAEAGVRAQSGGCARGQFDLTAGLRPNQNWLALAEAVTDAGAETEKKAQFSVGRFFRADLGVQLGLRVRTDDPSDEPALIIGLWSHR